MRRAILIVVIVLLALAVTPLQGAIEALDEGEFTLYNAVYNTATIQKSQTTVFLEKRLFKINTKTGDTWMLIDNIRDGRDVKYWKKIENDYGNPPPG